MCVISAKTCQFNVLHVSVQRNSEQPTGASALERCERLSETLSDTIARMAEQTEVSLYGHYGGDMES